MLDHQLALFDCEPVEPAPVVIADSCGASIEDYAFLYTATEKGNHSGIRFMMTVDDAKAWCSSDVSRGVLHGTQWAYFWTRVSSFIDAHELYPEEGRHALTSGRPCIDISKLKDNGQWDGRIAELGLKKIGFKDFAKILSPLGVDVIGGDQ